MTKLTVLVTDDDQDIRDGIEIYLKNEGYNVIKAADGIEALEKLNNNEVHLIIFRYYDAQYGWHNSNI